MNERERAALLMRIESAMGPEVGQIYPEAFLDTSRGFLATLDFPKDRFPTKFGAFAIFKTKKLVCHYEHGLN